MCPRGVGRNNERIFVARRERRLARSRLVASSVRLGDKLLAAVGTRTLGSEVDEATLCCTPLCAGGLSTPVTPLVRMEV